jgi:hypothetical protein
MVTGVLMDPNNGSVVAGVDVVLEAADQAIVASTVTDSDGRFALAAPDPTQSYTVVVETLSARSSVQVADVAQPLTIAISATSFAPPVQMPRTELPDPR